MKENTEKPQEKIFGTLLYPMYIGLPAYIREESYIRKTSPVLKMSRSEDRIMFETVNTLYTLSIQHFGGSV